MRVSVRAFLGLLLAVAVLRGVELVISHQHQKNMKRLGVAEPADPSYRWMVLLHLAVLSGTALEVVSLNRPFINWLAAAMGGLFLLSNVIRWWVIFTLGRHWNVRVMDSVGLGVITRGPFRLVRHPNYAAVFVELAALPLIHTAWLTASIGSLAHAWVLSRRLATEESVLLRNSDYRRLMADKPRFIPFRL